MLEEILGLNLIDARIFRIADVLTVIFVALVIGLFIFFVYSKTYKGVMYSSSFGVTLLMMTIITALVIYSVAINFMLSLGMVGALSIVRFRTVIKEPLDLAYLFWAITVGILVGAGFLTIATIGAITIGVILFIFVRGKPKDTPYMMVISCADDSAENEVTKIINDSTKKHMIKAKTVTQDNIELTIEVRIKKSSTEFVNNLSKIAGVHNVALVSYNGDYYM